MDMDRYRFAHPQTYTDICAENTHTRIWKGNVVMEAAETNKGEREREIGKCRGSECGIIFRKKKSISWNNRGDYYTMIS